jgi:hypothetical protein
MPITPKDVVAVKTKLLPPQVYEVWDRLIAGAWRNNAAVVYQDDAMDALAPLLPREETRQELFNNGWLDIEEAYRNVGWKVVYDKPHYSESYRASFTFTPKD